MGGADAIVFTAGVGEKSVPVRKDDRNKLGYFGIKIDQEKNDCMVLNVIFPLMMQKLRHC